MKKLILKIKIALITGAILFNSMPLAYADFPDVSQNHQNYEAINYLQENNVINGYSNGTFQPDKLVNRVEFLKIVIEGSNIDTTITTSVPFPDVDNEAWYGSYLREAYYQGWIQGYPDGTFKPEQTINKVEALKILGKVQNWQLDSNITTKPFNDTPLDQWYIPYVSYAKEHNYLEEAGSLFFPATVMSRANISEIIYRTLIENEDQSEPEKIPRQNPEEEETLSFIPVNFSLIAKDFYSNVILASDLPNTFYKNEVYVIEGSVDESYNEVSVIINGVTTSDYKTITAQVNDRHFSIPVHFRKAGNYNIGVLPGESGQTKATTISVLNSLPSTSSLNESSSSITNLKVKYSDDQTRIEFSTADLTMKKLTLSQDEENVSYLSRQNSDEIFVNYADFKDFSEDEVEYYVEIATLTSTAPLQFSSNFKKSDTKSFQATEHTFDIIEENLIVTNPPDNLPSVNPISFTGNTKVDTQIEAFAITPDGEVDPLDLSTNSSTGTYFGNDIIKAGGNFTYTYTPGKTGRYIVEINRENGEPIVNHPVYIGNIIPLIPDFFDLNQRTLFTGTLNLNSARTELLNYINDVREEYDLQTVEMLDELNELAQAHTDDMAENNYFGHVNLENQTPDDRRIAAGLPTPVSENIAKDVSVAAAHYGLLRSASHRENILNSNWETVGLGITLSEGHLFIAEEFSTNVLTSTDLQNFKNQLVDEINDLRTENNVSNLTYNLAIESASRYINDQVIDENRTLNNDLFVQSLEQNNVSGSSEAIGRNYNIWSTILSSILDENTILQSQWERLGVDVQTDASGIIHTILIINNP